MVDHIDYKAALDSFMSGVLSSDHVVLLDALREIEDDSAYEVAKATARTLMESDEAYSPGWVGDVLAGVDADRERAAV